jgi:hypothetical protein
MHIRQGQTNTGTGEETDGQEPRNRAYPERRLLLGRGIDRRFGYPPLSVFDEGAAQEPHSGERWRIEQSVTEKIYFPNHSNFIDPITIVSQGKK